MKRDKLFWILYGVLLALLLAAEGFAVAVVWRMNMLPGKYMALLVAVLLVLWLTVGALLLLPGKKKKRAGAARQVVAVVLAVAIVVGCAVAADVAEDLHETMQAITKPMVVSATISVYVRNDDPAQGLSDALGYTFGITGSFDVEHTEQFLDTMEQELGQQLSTKSFDSVFAMIDALYAKQVGAIVINNAYVQILEDSEVYASFTEKARVLFQVDIMEEVEIPTPPPVIGNNDEPDATGETNAENQTPEQDTVANTPFIIYIGGSDTRSTTLVSASRNDVNILAVVNPETKQLLLINTPRDYFVPNPAVGGALDKLTHCGIYGIDCSVKALSDLYEVPIQYYGQINFTGFEKLVDAVGGVTVYSDVAFTARSTYVRVGENHFNGKQALEFARERMSLAGGDNDRGKNQMKIIKAVVQEMASGAIISRYAEILEGLQGMFNTNISVDEISMLVKMQLSDMATWNVQTYAVSGWGGSEITCSMPGFYAYVTHPNMATVEYATELIKRVFAGEVLTQEDMQRS